MKRSGFVRFILVVLILSFSLTGCVEYEKSGRKEQVTSVNPEQSTIIATSMAVVTICDTLNQPLAGVPSSELSEVPEMYKDLPEIGKAMAPDMEKVAVLRPEWILSPVSLIADLKPKYEAIGADYAFLNLNSVQGMYKSIQQLGTLFQREEEAEALVDEFERYYKKYRKKHKNKEPKKVLILMGLPGSYVVATPKSYVGSLVELAGGINVYADEEKDFVNINTEDMLKQDPDVILRCAHALPDQVTEMFGKEFKTNDIWKHFDAVKNDEVYDLSYEYFGMSATFDYPKALKELEPILYGD